MFLGNGSWSARKGRCVFLFRGRFCNEPLHAFDTPIGAFNRLNHYFSVSFVDVEFSSRGNFEPFPHLLEKNDSSV